MEIQSDDDGEPFLLPCRWRCQHACCFAGGVAAAGATCTAGKGGKGGRRRAAAAAAAGACARSSSSLPMSRLAAAIGIAHDAVMRMHACESEQVRAQRAEAQLRGECQAARAPR